MKLELNQFFLTPAGLKLLYDVFGNPVILIFKSLKVIESIMHDFKGIAIVLFNALLPQSSVHKNVSKSIQRISEYKKSETILKKIDF
jgi:hypothetical protein